MKPTSVTVLALEKALPHAARVLRVKRGTIFRVAELIEIQYPFLLFFQSESLVGGMNLQSIKYSVLRLATWVTL